MVTECFLGNSAVTAEGSPGILEEFAPGTEPGPGLPGSSAESTPVGLGCQCRLAVNDHCSPAPGSSCRMKGLCCLCGCTSLGFLVRHPEKNIFHCYCKFKIVWH